MRRFTYEKVHNWLVEVHRFLTKCQHIFIHKFIVPLFRATLSFLIKAVKLIVNSIIFPPKMMHNIYFGILGSVYRMTRKFKTIGELMLLVFGLLWMFWPLSIPSIIKIPEHRMVIWIFSISFTGLLTVMGKRRLDKEMKVTASH